MVPPAGAHRVPAAELRADTEVADTVAAEATALEPPEATVDQAAETEVAVAVAEAAAETSSAWDRGRLACGGAKEGRLQPLTSDL